MATAEEKQAKQDALDATRASVTVGQRRLQTEVGQAAAAFPARRLRSAGDLSRYAIGGFLSDPNAPLPVPGTGPARNTTPPPVASGSSGGTGTRSGSGVTAPRSGAPSTAIPRSAQTPGQLASGFRGDLGYAPRPSQPNPYDQSSMGVGGAPGAYRPPATSPLSAMTGAPGAYRGPSVNNGSSLGQGGAPGAYRPVAKAAVQTAANRAKTAGKKPTGAARAPAKAAVQTAANRAKTAGTRPTGAARLVPKAKPLPVKKTGGSIRQIAS